MLLFPETLELPSGDLQFDGVAQGVSPEMLLPSPFTVTSSIWVLSIELSATATAQ